MIYHCSGCFSDQNWLVPTGSDWKLVGNWLDSVLSGLIRTDLSDWNPVGQIGQILGGPVFWNFQLVPTDSAWKTWGTDKTSL